ncbi:MAG TPA: peptidoglycan editing factor PgeF [Trebonia sp.]|nr:peptidoglycan editing factor PgeF [Trebonia sp.]
MTSPNVPPPAFPDRAAPGLRRRGEIDVLGWPAFAGHALDAVVTSRHGGVSQGPYQSLNLGLHVGDDAGAVLANRRRAAAALGAGLEDMVFCNQSHDKNVHVVTGADRGRGTRGQDDAIAATDALVTAEPGVVLVVMVADCVPIVLFDPVAHVLACVHAGWRGTVARVSEAAVQAMTALGSDPGDIIAGIGPAISPDAYQVGQDVAAAAAACFGERGASAVIRPDGAGKWLFDLWRANRVILGEAGVREDNTHLAAVPTGPAGGGLFFSDRQARPCGRFAAIARLHPRAGE